MVRVMVGSGWRGLGSVVMDEWITGSGQGSAVFIAGF